MSWPLQLPPTCLYSLEDKLRRCVTFVDDFRIINLSILHTKSNQLQGLQEIWNESVKLSNHMEEDIQHWRK